MSSLIDTNSPSGIDWEPHFAFIVPGMMRKSTLVIPVDSQNQERPIESADPSSFPSISLNASQNPTLSWCDKKKQEWSPAMKHVERMWSFVKNQLYCLSLTNIAHLHTSHDPFITSHLRFPHLCGTSITPLWGVYRECEYKLLNFFYYPSISYKSENNPSCHVTWWRIATDRWKSAKWPNLAKKRILTSVTPSQHVIPNRH